MPPPTIYGNAWGNYPITVSADGKHTLWYVHPYESNSNGPKVNLCVAQYDAALTDNQSGFDCVLLSSRAPENVDFVPNSSTIAIVDNEMYNSEIDLIVNKMLLRAEKNRRLMLYDFEKDRSLCLGNENLTKSQAEQKSLGRENAIYCPVSYTHLTLPTKA